VPAEGKKRGFKPSALCCGAYCTSTSISETPIGEGVNFGAFGALERGKEPRREFPESAKETASKTITSYNLLRQKTTESVEESLGAP